MKRIYVLWDTKEQYPIGEYKTRWGANRAMDRMNQEYGAYRYYVLVSWTDK